MMGDTTMTQRLAAALLALPLMFAAGAPSGATAQEQPVLLPTRDVAVTFRLSGSTQLQGDINAIWSATRRTLRVDNASAPGWLLVEQQAGRAYMVMQQGVVMRLPATPDMAQMLDNPQAHGRVTRGARRTIAGHSCTDWQIERQDGKGGVACVTADGVLLRAQQTGKREVLEATRVAYGAQDPARFRLPQGVPQIQLPANTSGLRLPGG
jgi:hypothetical protein